MSNSLQLFPPQVFAHGSPSAFPTLAFSCYKIGIFKRKFMAMNAMSLLMLMVANSTAIILASCHWFKMQWIATYRGLAEMIDVQAFRNWPNKKFVCKPVHLPIANDSINIVWATTPRTAPQPTARIRFNLNLAANSLWKRKEI